MEKEFDLNRAAEQIKKAEREHPEKLPFKQGEPVWVRNKETGKMEEWRFMSWDPNTGEAILTNAKEGEEERTQTVIRVGRNDLLEKSN